MTPQRSSDPGERLDAGIYFAGALFQRISLFLALPLLLRSLSAAQYGAFGLLQSAVNLLPAVLALNLPATVTRLYFDGSTEPERRAVATKLSVLSASIGLLGASLLWLCVAAYRGTAARLLGLAEQDVLLATALVLIGSLGSNHLQMAWGIWRAQNLAVRTATANGLTGALFLAAVAVLASTHRLGAVTAMGAYAGATALVGLSANALAVSGNARGEGTSYAAVAREALRYGLPVLPLLLAMWGLAAGGRWIARATLTLDDTGRFTLASQLATMIALVGRSAYESWAPRSFEMFATGRTQEARLYLRARSRLTVGIVVIIGVITAGGLFVALPRFAPAYGQVAHLFPLMALAPLFDVAYLPYQTELMGLKVTRPIPNYTAVTVAVFVVAGLGGAKLYGLWGLAAAYVLAYACQWILARRAVRQLRRRPPHPDGGAAAVFEGVGRPALD